ncbi:Bug family tripartite tricarboxylate transporter substrate binding protein [Alcaligenes endophyticus]|uniref:Tripartite tricarboxylate transporter substrate binding protein n=1 Tax=Alcaligenes endophyticus TaxID=1929088 RepID=A0ABT8EMU9_9BURK|nr:tripartite tricarboxylate transporter substrate binding protein [Alcaligenes endophyticus]MCX5591515.1 tripartite tricarboxylate transporter substrate binding protein [Alcaligenes endophyticus]MDN4122604.1 tripartite tricarboxylate transporter substrate binding protein [Alcaligenes endophyticus]
MKLYQKTIVSLCAGLSLLGLGTAQAQNYPERAVTMVVPFPAGGPTDLVARVVARKLSEQMGETFIVENKGGANGAIGMQAVAAARPDGYTILYNTSSIALTPNLYSKLSFTPSKDFVGVSSTATVPMVILTHPSVPADTLEEFIAYAKDNPNQLSFASAGAGNVTHLTAHLLNQATGISAAHIPYRGSAPGLVDLVGGQVQFMVNTINDSYPMIRDGRVKALAVTSSERSHLLPDVPTVAETVLPGFESGAWQGIAVPAKTPTEIIERLNKEITIALQSPEVKEQLDTQGTQVLGSSSEDYQTYIAQETKRWGEVIRDAGVKLD